MGLIYTPRGRAREYSPKALNIYLSCTHGCEYCYAPSCRHQTREQYFSKPYPRKNIADNLAKELDVDAPKEQVLLSFIGDVYCETHDDNEATGKCLELLCEHHVPVAILTKGGYRSLKHLDTILKFGEHIQVGTTLTFDNDEDSMKWESGAASPEERLDTLRTFHELGVRTFASFEPVIDTEQSLNLMEMGLDCIDTYKIGKLNNYKGMDKGIDWAGFLSDALQITRTNGKSTYVKHDLAECGATVQLYGTETLADSHCVRWG